MLERHPSGVSLNAIAAAVGYSKNTVSLALRGDSRIPDSTRQAIRDQAALMGYRYNPLVTQLMGAMRRSGTAQFRAKLALVRIGDRAEENRFSGLSACLAAVEARAAARGYYFDRFPLQESLQSVRHWRRVLATRGIRGLLAVSWNEPCRLHGPLAALSREFPCVVVGLPGSESALAYACVDYHQLMKTALDRACGMGYRRPGLILEAARDAATGWRYTAGFIAHQISHRAVPVLRLSENAALNLAKFNVWLGHHRPDVILFLGNDPRPWLQAAGLRAPRDVGLIALDHSDSTDGCAGLDQHADRVGQTAVDQLLRRLGQEASDCPDWVAGTFVCATWRHGNSVRVQASLSSVGSG